MNKSDQRKLRTRLRIAPTWASKQKALTEAVTGLSVLDVGCVGQARSSESDRWLHSHLAKAAKSIVGVDVDDDGVRRLRAGGWDVRLPDALGNERFERVVMGDVIEHVDDPVGFLSFYKDVLAPGGSILVTTPNAFAMPHILTAGLTGAAAVNEEHTMWFDPLTLAEVGARAGLRVGRVGWVEESYQAQTIVDGAIFRLSRAMSRVRPAFSDLLFFEFMLDPL